MARHDAAVLRVRGMDRRVGRRRHHPPAQCEPPRHRRTCSPWWLAWLALPLIINGFTNSRAGLTYQGRYSLPIFVGLAFLPMWSDRRPIPWPRLSQRRLGRGRRGLRGRCRGRRFLADAAAGSASVPTARSCLTGRLPWQPSVAPMALIAINAVAMAALCVCVDVVDSLRCAVDQPSDVPASRNCSR